MEKESRRYAIIDTETTRKRQKPFQVGIGLTDEDGNLTDLEAMWIPEFLEDDEPFYPPNPITLGFPVEKDIAKEVLEEINEQTAETFAFNSNFDKTALEKHCGVKFKKPLKDLWTAAAVHICDEEYIRWAEKNNYLTEKGNIRTGSEYVVKYILEDNDFKTAHCAAEDVAAESYILKHLIDEGIDVSKIQNHPAPWRIVKKRRDKMNKY